MFLCNLVSSTNRTYLAKTIVLSGKLNVRCLLYKFRCVEFKFANSLALSPLILLLSHIPFLYYIIDIYFYILMSRKWVFLTILLACWLRNLAQKQPAEVIHHAMGSICVISVSLSYWYFEGTITLAHWFEGQQLGCKWKKWVSFECQVFDNFSKLIIIWCPCVMKGTVTDWLKTLARCFVLYVCVYPRINCQGW